MDILIVPTLSVIYSVLSIVYWIVLVHIIISWLVAFKILNIQSNVVYSVVSFLSRFTEIFSSKIRNIIPQIGGLDLSLLVVLFAVRFLQGIVARILLRYVLVG